MAVERPRDFNVYTPEELTVFAEKLINAPIYIGHGGVENAAEEVIKCSYDAASRRSELYPERLKRRHKFWR